MGWATSTLAVILRLNRATDMQEALDTAETDNG